MLCYGTAIKRRVTGKIKVLRKGLAHILAAGAALTLAVPAGAQGFSEGYQFIQAVKEGDGNKVTEMITSSVGTILNTRDRETGDTALHIIARDRNLQWTRFLLSKGARVDAQNDSGETALSLASRIGWAEGAQVLLTQGAAVDLANNRGETPLIIAVQARDLPMVRLLMGKGADPKKTDRAAGYSALDYAKRDRRAAIILKELEAPSAKPKQTMGPSL